MDIYDILVEEYGLSPEQVDELMQLGVLTGEATDIIPRQQEYAQGLRGARTPQGRVYGGVYEEANPMEHLGSGLERMAGHFKEEKARQRQQEILEKQAKLRAQYLRGMGGAGGPPPGGGAAPMPPPQPAVPRPLAPQQGTPYDQWQPYIGPQPLRR